MLRVLCCLAMLATAPIAHAGKHPEGVQSARVGRSLAWSGVGILGASLPLFAGGAGFMHYNYSVPFTRKAAYDRRYIAWLETGRTVVPISGAVTFVGMGALFTGTLSEAAGLKRSMGVRVNMVPWIMGSTLTVAALVMVPFSASIYGNRRGILVAHGCVSALAVGSFLLQFGLNRRGAKSLSKEDWETIYGARPRASVGLSPLLDPQRERYGIALTGVF